MRDMTVTQVEEMIELYSAEQARHNRRALALQEMGNPAAAEVSVRDAEIAMRNRQMWEERLEGMSA